MKPATNIDELVAGCLAQGLSPEDAARFDKDKAYRRFLGRKASAGRRLWQAPRA
ncbi:MAG: hypothetical protein LBS63_03665 [Prevotellaceae bacterium]|nr:hypothetical protein [Prevotellaceae bacterium]